MPAHKLREFLDANQVKYVTIEHSPAYTAQEIAAVAHVPGKELAKSVIVNIDGQMAMIVLPGDHRINFEKLKAETGAEQVTLADEGEFGDLFTDCTLGAMPPFGNLYGLEVIVDQSLAGGEEIAFNACTHTELMRLSYKDFERLVKPRILDFSR